MRQLDIILENAINVTVFMSWQRHYNLVKRFNFDKLVYEYIDDLAVLYYSDENAENVHRKLLEQADLTVATAQRLYQEALPFAKKLILSENAGDYNFFSTHRTDSVNMELKKRSKSYVAVLGYYGSLAFWFDYGLIKNAASEKSEWLFVLVGFDFDGTAASSGLGAYENILLFSAQPYEKLPSFLNGFDIALIPFVVNDITNATSPVKLFEYMAAGKPVLTADLPECQKYKSVYRYHATEEFISQAEKLLELRDSAIYLDLLNREARENTWETRVNQILSALECGENS
jgi:glycosyltransferase involved in cell wall biosynthesis